MFFALFAGFSLEKNDTVLVFNDSTNRQIKVATLITPNIKVKIDTATLDTVKDKAFKPDPTKVIWLGTIIPGYGQIANRKYWKLPIVYGGFMGFAYAISWNNGRYNSFKNAFRDISDSDPTTVSYLDIVPKGYEYIPPGGKLQDQTKIAFIDVEYKKYLSSRKETFQRYRDMSILLSIGYYAIVILEAYVDAHLYDFDITPNLALRISPSYIHTKFQRSSAYGLQCSIRF